MRFHVKIVKQSGQPVDPESRKPDSALLANRRRRQQSQNSAFYIANPHFLKRCKVCWICKPLAQFARSSVNMFGAKTFCRKCRTAVEPYNAERAKIARTKHVFPSQSREKQREYEKRYWAKHPEKLKAKKRRYQILHAEHVAQYQKRYKEKNRDAIRKQKQEYYQTNKGTIDAQKRAWVNRNRAEVAAYLRQYIRNPEYKKRRNAIAKANYDPVKARESHKRYYPRYREQIIRRTMANAAERRREDPIYRLACNLRARISNAIKRNSKSASTMILIGCSVPELKTHLESMFYGGMTWENYGVLWHVDHRKPCASFDLSDPNQQLECFHYLNLQPLTAEENLRKHSKLDWQDAKQQFC